MYYTLLRMRSMYDYIYSRLSKHWLVQSPRGKYLTIIHLFHRSLQRVRSAADSGCAACKRGPKRRDDLAMFNAAISVAFNEDSAVIPR